MKLYSLVLVLTVVVLIGCTLAAPKDDDKKASNKKFGYKKKDGNKGISGEAPVLDKNATINKHHFFLLKKAPLNPVPSNKGENKMEIVNNMKDGDNADDGNEDESKKSKENKEKNREGEGKMNSHSGEDDAVAPMVAPVDISLSYNEPPPPQTHDASSHETKHGGGGKKNDVPEVVSAAVAFASDVETEGQNHRDAARGKNGHKMEEGNQHNMNNGAQVNGKKPPQPSGMSAQVGKNDKNGKSAMADNQKGKKSKSKASDKKMSVKSSMRSDKKASGKQNSKSKKENDDKNKQEKPQKLGKPFVG